MERQPDKLIPADRSPEQRQPEEIRETISAPDPGEYLPVMRHHLAEAHMALTLACQHSQAQDLVDSYRAGQMSITRSKFTTRLERALAPLEIYLGYVEDEEDEDESSGE